VAAIAARGLTINAMDSIGNSGSMTRIPIPDGDYSRLTDDQAQLLSNATYSDVVGCTYGVVRYIGSAPLDVSKGLPPLSDASLFEVFKPTYVAGQGPVYRYLGTERINTSLAEVDFNAKGADQQPLWQRVLDVNPAKVNYNTTAVGVNLFTGNLVLDTRADLRKGDVVLVDTPALYGYVQYNGMPRREDLLLSDFGLGSADQSLWTQLRDGTQSAPITPKKLPASGLLQPGALVTDPSLLSSVTIQLQNPLSVSLQGGPLNATSGTSTQAGVTVSQSGAGSKVLKRPATSESPVR
jgi:hypothetical protein